MVEKITVALSIMMYADYNTRQRRYYGPSFRRWEQLY